jgi:hypothetical protein
MTTGAMGFALLNPSYDRSLQAAFIPQRRDAPRAPTEIIL